MCCVHLAAGRKQRTHGQGAGEVRHVPVLQEEGFNRRGYHPGNTAVNFIPFTM